MLKQKSDKLKQQDKQIITTVPPVNIFVLNFEKLLTEKYNQTAIKQIQAFQTQLS